MTYEPVDDDQWDDGMAMGLVVTSLGAILGANPPYSDRCVAREEVDGIEISTALTVDLGYETALFAESGWRPVERYETREQAVEGHERWKAQIPSLSEITDIGYPGVVQSTQFQLRS